MCTFFAFMLSICANCCCDVKICYIDERIWKMEKTQVNTSLRLIPDNFTHIYKDSLTK